MKTILQKLRENGAAAAVIALLVVAIYATSWIATCLIVKGIMWCFGLTFSWRIGTGVWLAFILLRSVASAAKSNK